MKPASVLVLTILFAAFSSAQIRPGPSAGQNPFLGSVSSGSAASGELALSLNDAIDRGLKSNLGAVLASQGERAARAQRLEALSALLPNLSASLAESSQQVNLAAFGFKGLPGVAPIVGPFSIIDARAHVSVPILDLRALRNTRAGSAGQKSAEYSYLDARDTVVQVVTLLYLQTVTGSSRIDVVRAQVATAQALYDQAVDFKQAGTVPAIDVLRARVELDAEKQQLIFFENEFEKQKLMLARIIGLPDGQAIRLTDPAPSAPPPDLGIEAAIAQAYDGRMDFKSAASRVEAADLRHRAAEAGRLPSAVFRADYGAIGPAPDNAHGTYSAAAGLNIPLFQGGRVKAETLAAEAELEQRRAELADLRGRIAAEVRTSFLDLSAANRQAEVAKEAMSLADQQVIQARDRFAAGVTNNLEVVQAQQALAAANQNYISSLLAYNTAKVALARAMGGTENRTKALLWGTKLP